ncbi:hypothetical protein [Ketobacter sp.]|nr:MAG: hypothetical protein D6160_08975 [Ketobacter sp.]
MTILRSKYQQLEDKLHALSVRERVILAVAVGILILGLFDQLLLRGLMAERVQIESEKADVLQNLQVANNTIEALEKTIANNPNLSLQQAIGKLQVSEQRIDDQINSITTGMIEPSQMAYVLGELLSDESGLKILSIHSSAAHRLMVADEQQQQSAAIYRHELELKMEGSFFQMKKYLRALEALPERVVVDELEYKVNQHPDGALVLNVHTLSPHEELIRVVQ